MRGLVFLGMALLAAAGCAGGGRAQGAGGSTATSSTSASSSTSGGGAHADAGADAGGFDAATGVCGACEGGAVDLANDPRHCGACGHACPSHTLCARGACAPPTCLVQEPSCPTDHVCCGGACCPPWQMCCDVATDGGVAAPACIPLEAGACPTSCAG